MVVIHRTLKDAALGGVSSTEVIAQVGRAGSSRQEVAPITPVTEQFDPTKATPTVFIVDGDPAVQRSLREMAESIGLHSEDYPDAILFLEDYDPARVGCLIMAIRLPRMGVLDLQDELRRRGYDLPVIVHTAYAEVSLVVEVFRRGAFDFFAKPCKAHELLRSIQRAVARDIRSRESRTQRTMIAARRASLTRRELQVMDLVIAGKRAHDIATEFNRGRKTIYSHIERVMDKMCARSTAELTHMALALETD